MTVASHREKIGKVIIVAHLSIFVLIFILYALGGFLTEELADTLKFLIPIKTIYITALVKFIIANKNKEESEETPIEINPLYKNVTNIFIYTHIILLMISVLLVAFNGISFPTFQNTISIIETFFGTYIGLIITDMFKVNKE